MEMQIWNNAVFDDGGSGGRFFPCRPLAGESFSVAGKENRNPGSPILKNQLLIDDVDVEIEKVEKEIERLQARLKELRVKKTEEISRKDSLVSVKRGRIVPSKFLDPSTRKQEAFDSPARGRSGQRSFSLGPLEIRSEQSKRKSVIQNLIVEEKGEVEKKEHIRNSCTGYPLLKEEVKGDSLKFSKRKFGIQKLKDLEEEEGQVEKKEICRNQKLKVVVEEEGEVEEKELCRNQKLKVVVEEEGEVEKKVLCRNSLNGYPLSEEEIKRDGLKLRNSMKIVQPRKLFQETKKQFKRAAAPPLPKEKANKPPEKASNVRTVSSRYSLVTVKVGRSNPLEGRRRKWSLPGMADKPPAAVADGAERRSWKVEREI